MARSLRDLIRLESEEDLAGAAGAVKGKFMTFQQTCWQHCMCSYHDNCCMSFIVPAGASTITFDVWGGGGGGGKNCCCGRGFGGQSGSYAQKTVKATEGDCFAMILGISTSCTENVRGCTGCFSCVCGVGLDGTGSQVNVCTEGGSGGCNCCSGNCCVECARRDTTDRCAYGGDINIKSVKACSWHRCASDSCYDKVSVAYPGGIINQCGGNIWLSRCNSCDEDSTFMKCVGSSYLGSFFSGYCRGYVPGLGGMTGSGRCGESFFCCYYWYWGCCVPCTISNAADCCGSPGSPGLIRVTYK